MTDAEKKGADNNIYKETFGAVTLSEERRREILQIPQGGAESTKGTNSTNSGKAGVFGRKRFSTAMVCVLVLVLVTGTAAAVSSAGSLSDWFEREWRSSNGKEMSVEQMGVIGSLTTPLDISDTVEGVTATLDSIAYSDGNFWMLINVSGMAFDTKESNAFKEFTLKACSESGVDFSGGWSVTSQSTDDGETLQVLIDGSLDSHLIKECAGEKINFEMILGDLTENAFHKEKSRILQAGEWKFEFEITQETTGRTLTADTCEIITKESGGQKVNCTVSELELNSVNISYHIKPGEGCTDEHVHQESPRILLKSGYEVGISGGSGSQMADGCWGMEYQLSMPIDVDDVRAVKIGETEIPVK